MFSHRPVQWTMQLHSQMQKMKPKGPSPLPWPPRASDNKKGTNEHEPLNWLELPHELTSSILSRLGSIEILDSAQNVCKTWYKICKDRCLWKSIDMRHPGYFDDIRLDVMCRHAVDRSGGGLVDINVGLFATDKLLMYIADRAPNLKGLRVVFCPYDITDEGVAEVVAKLPLLEDLELVCVDVGREGLAAVGLCCPHLKSLNCNLKGLLYNPPPEEFDEEALAIAETMPELRHLQLCGNKLTDNGLQAILDCCPHLESLDLRQCFNITLGRLEKLQTNQFTNLKLPHDSTADIQLDESHLFRYFDGTDLSDDENDSGEEYEDKSDFD